MTDMLEAVIKKVGWEKLDGQTVCDIILNSTSMDLNVITRGVSPVCVLTIKQY